MKFSKRFKNEEHRTFWQSGLLRAGDHNERKYWMTERREELNQDRRGVNPFAKRRK